jgi:phage shock protein A
MNPKEYAARMLAEVKLQERKLAKLEEVQGQRENAIRAALRASDRERAEKLAVEYERGKQEVAQKQTFLADARTQFEQAKRRSKDMARGMKSAKTLDATVKAMEGINKSMDTLSGAEDMLRQIEEQVAFSEAKLEIATDEAAQKADRVIDLAPEIAANDILAEFEKRDAKPAAEPPTKASADAENGLAPGGQPPAKTIGPAAQAPAPAEETPGKSIGPAERSPDEILKDFE